jgi:predicted naringenin-chalcone synthase
MERRIIALTNFQSVMPSLVMQQSELVALAADQHLLVSPQFGEERMRKLFRRFGVKPAQISQRAIESNEFPQTHHDMHDRMNFFAEKSQRILQKFYGSDALPPSHIMHVTCTGYVSPSSVQRLVTQRCWSGKTKVTHAYHMGCYASLPAIRLSEGLVAAGERSVDIIHNEMCSLHFNAQDNSLEQLVVQTLFADGHIKYSAVPLASANQGFAVLKVSEAVLSDSVDDITWVPAKWGMKMTLSREVPDKISRAIREFVLGLVEESGHRPEKLLKEAIFAVHPGGPRIIEVVQKTLELSDHQVEASFEILKNRGNMSSATLPHVWHHLLKKVSKGDRVISLAFGPGLTLFGALFEVL